MSVATTLRILAPGTVNLNGGDVTTTDFDHTNGGTFNFTDGTLTVTGGVFDINANSLTLDGPSPSETPTLRLINGATSPALTGDVVIADVNKAALEIGGGSTIATANAVVARQLGSTGTVTVTDAGSTWTVENLFLGVASGGDATLAVNNGALVDVTDVMAAGVRTNIDLGGGTIQTATLDLQGANVSGFGTIVSQIESNSSATINAIGGNLTLGNAASFSGFNYDGILHVGAETVTLNSAGFANLGILTTITGGTLIAPNGVTLGVGDNLQAGSTVDAKVAAGFGSTIVATGNLTMGDASSVVGFFSDGVFFVGDNNVTLLDANQAVLGSLTQLGDITGGTLTADNGVIVEVGKNVAGFGTVDTPNDILRPTIVNGAVVGDSIASPITFTGWVKGVGTFDNVVFAGTFSPGFSPAAIALGSSIYEGDLIVELGGTTPGSSFDQLSHFIGTGIANLGGDLHVQLINGFIPSAGDTFEFIRAIDVVGVFNSEVLPSLPSHLALHAFYSTDAVTLAVVPALPGDYNTDGVVDAADYTVWRDLLGSTGVALAADGNHSGTVDAADYDIWRMNFGSIAPALNDNQGAVPEPSTCLGIVLAVMLMQCMNRCSRKTGTAVSET